MHLRINTAKMSINITEQQVGDIALASTISNAMDESCDISDTAQVSLFVRYLSVQGPKEELLGLLPLKGQTRGEDIADAEALHLENYGNVLYRLSHTTTVNIHQ